MHIPYYLKGVNFSFSDLYPGNFLPKLEVDSVADIDLEGLTKRGIKGLIFDVDNTLCKYRGTNVDEIVKENFLNLKKGFNTCILSNTDDKRRAVLEEHFGMRVVQSKIKKPAPTPYLEAMEYLQTKPETTAMIGDRFLTDIVGANKLGIYSIRVKPLHPETSPFAIKTIRAFEDFWYGK